MLLKTCMLNKQEFCYIVNTYLSVVGQECNPLSTWSPGWWFMAQKKALVEPRYGGLDLISKSILPFIVVLQLDN